MNKKFPYKLVDLTHTLSENTPSWDGGCGFNHDIKLDYDECDSAVKFKVGQIKMHAGIGTHIDAPSHCIPGAATVEQMPLDTLIAPLVVIDVHEKMTANYKISDDDIILFENKYGQIKENSFIAFYTGWSQYWNNPKQYHNNYSFPSISESAANILVARNVAGIGIDTLSPDVPASGFPVHKTILGADKYIVENIANLEKMPAIGAYVLTLPIKGLGLIEAPVRMVGLMKYFKILKLILCTLAIASNAYAKECFISSKNNKLIHVEGDCNKRYSPCSTFKIAISLMGFDSGILIDETHPTWDFKSGYVDWLELWKQPHNPKMWLANSCVWYSQVITKKLGEKQFSEYTHRFAYGNQDTSGDKGMNNGLTNCWLSSSLAISPKEQIHFLNKLVTNTLPVSLDAQEKTKNIMYQETLPSGWELYGKTGNGSQLDADSNKIKDRQVGWFVGFIRKGEKVITFVQLIADEDKQDTYASLRAKTALKKNIEKIIFNNSISQNNIILHDNKHDRTIPIAIYSNETDTKNTKLPVVIISHGYGVKNTEYTFIAYPLAAQGYYVISVQHDLNGDSDLPRAGNLYQARMPFWERGVKSLKFAIDNISKTNPELDMSKVILIGHSNGGDISMMFANKYPSKVKQVISLDSLRYPFPTNSNILSLRANDTSADNGVLIKNTNAKIIQMSNAKHIDMHDAGPDTVKAEIIDHINDFLQQ